MLFETQRNKKRSEECQEDGTTLKRTTEGRRERVLNHAEKRRRSKEDRIARYEKKMRKLKAESVSRESISDTDL